MTTGAAPGSSRITLFGIALIWMTAQVMVAVAHDWIARPEASQPKPPDALHRSLRDGNADGGRVCRQTDFKYCERDEGILFGRSAS
jgi:hypothetical protein